MSNSLLPVYNRVSLEFIAGEKCYLISKEKKKYLDLGAGIAVNSLGYANKKLVKVLKSASEKPWHLSNIYQISGQEKLADKLVANSSCDQVYFCNSGSESIETAFKIVRRYFNAKKDNQKTDIISFENAFHGRTFAAICAGGSKKIKEGYEPLIKSFKNIALKYSENIEYFSKKITDKTAAVILEPIQGEGGIHIFSNKFLKDLALLCKKREILLIVDEVQSGIGRTGKFFAYEHSAIKPDIITVAKGIGGGFPLAACLVTEKVGSVMTAGSHGGTYGGNPLAMSVGNEVLDQVLAKGFIEGIKEKGVYFKEELQKLQKLYPQIIEEVRGVGLMIGLKVAGDHLRLVEILRNNLVLTVPASNSVIRILPPLIITKKDIDIAIKIINKSIKEFK